MANKMLRTNWEIHMMIFVLTKHCRELYQQFCHNPNGESKIDDQNNPNDNVNDGDDGMVLSMGGD